MKYFNVFFRKLSESEKEQSLEDFPGCAAKLHGEITLSGCHFGCRSHCVERVLAAEISNHESIFRPRNRFAGLRRSELLPFLERSRRLMSWRRGAWEDAVMGHAATPLSLSETFRRGVFRAKDQLLH
jgi:hypothetical protein